MSFLERAKNKVTEFVSNVEENVGGALGDQAMRAHGEAEEAAAEEREDELEVEDGDDPSGTSGVPAGRH